MEPFLGEIRIFPLQQAPKGWAFCNGQLLPINQNQALFALLGTTFGGNGQTNFALPNFQGRVPIHTGVGHNVGEAGGEVAHTISIAEMPQHIHFLTASGQQGNSQNPRFGTTGHLLAQDPGNVYTTSAVALGTFAAGTVTNVGGSQAHMNMQPYLALGFCIALQGIFPSQN